MHARDEECTQTFGLKTLTEGTNFRV